MRSEKSNRENRGCVQDIKKDEHALNKGYKSSLTGKRYEAVDSTDVNQLWWQYSMNHSQGDLESSDTENLQAFLRQPINLNMSHCPSSLR